MAFWYSVGALVYFLIAALGGWPGGAVRGASRASTIAAHPMLMLLAALLWPMFLVLDIPGSRTARR